MEKWTVREEAGVAIVQLDDGKANTLTLAEFDGMRAAFDQARRSSAQAVLFTGRPGYFSAGLNLKVMPTLELSELMMTMTRFGEVVAELFLFEKPVVAAVTGHALGGGAIFGFASDVRLFAEGPFKYGLNEVAGGLVLPAFGMEVARSCVPTEHLLEVALHAKVMNPQEALKLRIAESVHPPEQLFAVALARAQMLAELGGQAYAKTKLALRGEAEKIIRARLPLEVESFSKMLSAKSM